MKKLTVLILAALMAITCVSAALAANWVEIGRNNDIIHFVDVSSVRRTGNTFRLWKKCILRTPQAQAEWKKNLKSSKTPDYYITYTEYKIDEPTGRRISAIYYTKDDTSIYSDGESYEWNVYPPDSVGEAMWDFGRIILEFRTEP